MQEIEARVEAATDGPWEVVKCDNEKKHFQHRLNVKTKLLFVDMIKDGSRPKKNCKPYQLSVATGIFYGACQEYDAIFIAEAKTDIPRLIATVRALWEEFNK